MESGREGGREGERADGGRGREGGREGGGEVEGGSRGRDTGLAGIFVWRGPPPGRRHPASHQSCTRLKLSRGAGSDVSTPVVSRVMGGAPERSKIAKNIGEMTFGGGFL